MRGWMSAAPSCVPPVQIGAVMRAGAAGRVIAAEHPGSAVGEHVGGMFGVQEHAVPAGRAVLKAGTEVTGLPVHLGALGMTGWTAYLALLDVARPRPGTSADAASRERTPASWSSS